MALSLFKPKALTVKKEPVFVSVPDIKEYLVKEYERVNLLREENERLLDELEKAKEVQMKYEATLVTLDEYSKRIDYHGKKLTQKDRDIIELQKKVSQARNELNSYKIKFNEAAITKEEIKEEVISDFRKELISKIKNHKGNLSKGVVCQIINGEPILPSGGG